MNIGIDMDGTLVQHFGVWSDYYNEKCGTCHEGVVSNPPPDWGHYINTCKKCYFNFIESDEALLRGELMPNAGDVLQELKDRKHNLFLVSTRPVSKTPAAAQLLNNLGVLEFFTATSWSMEPKNQRCRALHLDMMLDDKPTIYDDLAGTGIHVALYDQPYNRGIELATRMHNWEEFLNYVNGFKPLWSGAVTAAST
jgi:5'(3')-deoxyribonucleotidase